MNTKAKQCCVPYCGNNSFETPHKVFISTPSCPTKRQEWFEAASNVYNKHLHALTVSHCCEDHFDATTDFVNWMECKTVGTRLKLRPNVIPHIFKIKPNSKKELSPSLGPLEKICTAMHLDDSSTSEQQPSGSEVMGRVVEPTRSVCTQTENIETNRNPVHEVCSDTTSTNKNFESSTKTAGTEDVLKESGAAVSSANDEDEQNLLKNYVENNTTIMEKQSYLDLGLPKEQYFLVKILSEHAKCPYINILISLKKIKLNDTFERLSREFSVPETTVRTIFVAAVPKVAALIKQFIIWPDCKSTFENLPVQCRAVFLNIQSIVDFFEVQIEKPVSLIHQSLTWSTTKKAHTMKYFISVNPNGIINFISPGCGGKTSQMEIIQNSTYLNVLPSNTTVFGNKYLTNLQPLVSSKNCKYVTPLTIHEQLTEQDVDIGEQVRFLFTQGIGIISKLRNFQMLNSNGVEKSCIHLLDCIVTIACGLVNLQEPTDASDD